MTVTTRGERELAVKFESFPQILREKLRERIGAITEQLLGRVRAATPVRTGRLRSEVTSRVFADSPQRVAGYVEIYAPGVPNEYAKAATLEYGTDKVRRSLGRKGILAARLNRARPQMAAHIEAQRYLRGPFDEMRAQMQAAISDAINEAEGA